MALDYTQTAPPVPSRRDPSKPPVRWGILGTGWIAMFFMDGFPKDGSCEVVAVAGHTQEKADAFAAQHHIPHAYGTLEELSADPQVDVVYIATPTSGHAPQIIACLEAGKHVLCEKTITMNGAQLDLCIEAAKRNHVILAEGLTSVYEPVMDFMAKKVRTGEYGDVQFITVTCGSDKPYDATNRYFSPALGGGAIFDIGCYAIGFANYFMSSYPTQVLSQGVICPTGVDSKSTYLLSNDEHQLATVAISLRSKTEKIGIVACEKAFIRIEQFIRAHRAEVHYPDGRLEIYDFPVRHLDAEVEAMNSAIDQGLAEIPQCPIALSRSILKVMDTARAQWGYSFDFEKEGRPW